MSLNVFWSHHIDGWANIQKSPTALTINPDSGYVLRPAPPIKWIGVQEGNFLELLQAFGTSSGDASWATTGFRRAQPPFFAISSFTFKLTLWVVLLRSFRQSLMRSSGLSHPKQFQFFLWYSLIALAKQMTYPIDRSAPPTPFKVSALFSQRLSLLFPFWLYAWVFHSFSVFHYSGLCSKSTVALQLPRGKQIPWCLWLVNIRSSSCGGLREQRISGFHPFSNFQAARSRSE